MLHFSFTLRINKARHLLQGKLPVFMWTKFYKIEKFRMYMYQTSLIMAPIRSFLPYAPIGSINLWVISNSTKWFLFYGPYLIISALCPDLGQSIFGLLQIQLEPSVLKHITLTGIYYLHVVVDVWECSPAYQWYGPPSPQCLQKYTRSHSPQVGSSHILSVWIEHMYYTQV